MAHRTKPPLVFFEAEDIANGLIATIAPFCEPDFCKVAGSVRRKRPNISDIEVCCIPKWEDREVVNGLFAEPKRVNLLYEWAQNVKRFEDANGRTLSVEWIKTGVNEAIPWQIKEDGKYWRGALAVAGQEDYVRLDLFLASRETWPIIFTIRTGSADFSHALVARALSRNTPVKEGRITNFGKPVTIADEYEVFRYLGLKWIPPEERRNEADVHRAVIQ